MKKNVLITMTYMHIGGGERSLLGLLHSFDYTKYDVDLFLFSHEGALACVFCFLNKFVGCISLRKCSAVVCRCHYFTVCACRTKGYQVASLSFVKVDSFSENI